MTLKETAVEVIRRLTALYLEAAAELNFTNPYETLVATILSAQCTDKRVNKVTEDLFHMYPDVYSMSRLESAELEPLIRECGLFRNKAKNIINACRYIAENCSGIVPSTREELMKLPGVGQKTAGVVLLAAFGDDQIPVDTHVFRVSNRIGLCETNTPEKTETALREIIPKNEWSHSHHLLIWHGRRCCTARNPMCTDCPLNDGLCAKKNVYK